MEYLVYILRCGDGSLYTGCTNDLPRRLRAHQSGRGAKYTRSRLPVELIYQEPAADRSAALRREAADDPPAEMGAGGDVPARRSRRRGRDGGMRPAWRCHAGFSGEGPAQEKMNRT